MKHFPLLKLAVAISLLSAGAAHAAAETPSQTPAADADGSISLGVTSVTGDGVAGQSTTEGTGSYTTGKMNTATKLPMSIRETPQQVTVITRQRMDDQGLRDINDVVTATTGLVVQKYGSERVSYKSRGFTVDNLMYDGLPTDISTYTQDVVTGADSAIFDRVEVVRGATGLMQGAGNPAAAINMVRKKPTATPQASVSVGAGSWDTYRTEADVSGPLTPTGNIRGRLVTAYQDGNSFQDYTSRERGVYYGVLEADLNDATTLTVGSSYQNDNKNSNWGGLPWTAQDTDPHYGRSAYAGQKWSYWNTDVTTLFTNLEHRFDNGWKLNLAMNEMWARIHMMGNYRYNYLGTQYAGAGQYIYTDDHRSYDAYASGPFQLFGREHELVVGTSYRQELFDGHGGWGNDSVEKPVFDTHLWSLKTDNSQVGTYVTTRLSLADPLKLILGTRLDWYEGQTEGADTLKETRHVTRYAGLVYDLNETYSVYASFTDIFKPQSQFGAYRTPLAPITGKNYEFGIKGEYFDGALNAGAALFLVNQEGRAVTDTSSISPCPGNESSTYCSRASGEVQSKGIDIDVNGALTPNWQFSAGYTYAHVQYVKDATNQGDRFSPDSPQHLFKLSTTYHLPGQFNRFRVGSTFSAQTATYAEDYPAIRQSGYALLDLMAGYKVSEHIDTRVNLNNAFDRTYYNGITLTNLNYGDPRNVMFTVKWTL